MGTDEIPRECKVKVNGQQVHNVQPRQATMQSSRCPSGASILQQGWQYKTHQTQTLAALSAP